MEDGSGDCQLTIKERKSRPKEEGNFLIREAFYLLLLLVPSRRRCCRKIHLFALLLPNKKPSPIREPQARPITLSHLPLLISPPPFPLLSFPPSPASPPSFPPPNFLPPSTRLSNPVNSSLALPRISNSSSRCSHNQSRTRKGTFRWFEEEPFDC